MNWYSYWYVLYGWTGGGGWSCCLVCVRFPREHDTEPSVVVWKQHACTFTYTCRDSQIGNLHINSKPELKLSKNGLMITLNHSYQNQLDTKSRVKPTGPHTNTDTRTTESTRENKPGLRDRSHPQVYPPGLVEYVWHRAPILWSHTLTELLLWRVKPRRNVVLQARLLQGWMYKFLRGEITWHVCLM